jgi:coenzyme F420-reducing hydrogenase alpha subunit
VKINAGELKYILKDIDSQHDEAELNEAWNTLFDDYIEKRGLSKQYKKLLEIMKQKAIYECEYIITGDAFKMTQIEVEEQKLKDIIGKETVDISVEKSLIYLSKWLGYRLDWKVITLSEYYLIMEEYGKAN